MEKTVICPNCRANVEIHSDKCPYCGYINESGAEEKYMKKLSDIRDNLDRIDDEAVDSYKGEMKTTTKKIFKILMILVAVLLVFTALFYGMEKLIDATDRHMSATDSVDEIIWQKSYYAQLNEMYENGQYDEVADKLFSDETDGHDIYTWEHYDFISVHRRYTEVRDVYLKALDENDFDYIAASGMIYDSFYYYYELYRKEYTIKNKLTEEEFEILDKNREFILEVVSNRMHFTDEQMAAFVEKKDVLEDSHLSYTDCKKLGKKYWKQFN